MSNIDESSTSKITKAVIPVAGFGTRLYPATKIFKKEFFPIVDREDGYAKPAVQLIIEEAVRSGIEELCLIIQDGDEEIFRSYFDEPPTPEKLRLKLESRDWAAKLSKRISELGKRISYAVQKEQEGYGHAVYCAKDWADGEPFLLMLGDHIYKSYTDKRCARQILDMFEKFGGSVIAVQKTPEELLSHFGTVAGKRHEDNSRLYRVSEIREKPSINYARKHLRIDGLEKGQYFCMFGQYALTSGLFDCLKYQVDNDIRERDEIQLTTALQLLHQDEKDFYAYETNGKGYDIGNPKAYVQTISEYHTIDD